MIYDDRELTAMATLIESLRRLLTITINVNNIKHTHIYIYIILKYDVSQNKSHRLCTRRVVFVSIASTRFLDVRATKSDENHCATG